MFIINLSKKSLSKFASLNEFPDNTGKMVLQKQKLTKHILCDT